MTRTEARNLAAAAERLAARLQTIDRAGLRPSPRAMADIALTRVALTAACAEAAAEARRRP